MIKTIKQLFIKILPFEASCIFLQHKTNYDLLINYLIIYIFIVKQGHFKYILPSVTFIVKQISSFIVALLKYKKINVSQDKVY